MFPLHTLPSSVCLSPPPWFWFNPSSHTDSKFNILIPFLTLTISLSLSPVKASYECLDRSPVIYRYIIELWCPLGGCMCCGYSGNVSIWKGRKENRRKKRMGMAGVQWLLSILAPNSHWATTYSHYTSESKFCSTFDGMWGWSVLSRFRTSCSSR